MKTRLTVTFMMAMSLLGTATLFTQPNVLAASTHNHARLVRFIFRNNTSADITIRCGNQLIPVKAKGFAALALPEGASVTAEHSFTTFSAGDLVVQVAKNLEGNTVIVH
jgi:hypothetical protein